MGSIRVFVGLISVLLVLDYSPGANAQSGAFVEYEDTNSTLNRGLARANSMFSKIMDNIMSGSGSPIYDMKRNGSTLGINVLSGMVKVDRVREPGKPRSLSVRVFGIPVFNRGPNSRYPLPSETGSRMKPETGESGDRRGGGEEEDELPIDLLAR